MLVATRPDVVETLHRSFFDVGVDVVETDSFGFVLRGSRRVRHRRTGPRAGLRVGEDRPARCRQLREPDEPKFVAGSMGPGTKFPTLGQISYDDLSASYEELALGLLEGGVDLLLVETMFDLLSGKAAIAACHRAMARHGRVVPDSGPGHDRAHRPDVARHRDRCRHRRALPARSRRPRTQLRHRTRRDVRAAAHTVRQAPHARLVHAQRRLAQRRRRPDALRPHARGAGRTSVQVRDRVRRPGRRWMLRHDARAPAPRHRSGSTAQRGQALAGAEPAVTSIYSAVNYQQDRSRAARRRAHQRERLKEVSRGHARG